MAPSWLSSSSPTIKSEMIMTVSTDNMMERKHNKSSFMLVDKTMWYAAAVKVNDHMHVGVKPKSLTERVTMRVQFCLIGHNNKADLIKKSVFTFNPAEKVHSQGLGVLDWADVLANYVNDDGQVYVGVRLVKFVPPPPLNMPNILYSDMTLLCADVEFPVNMCIVAGKSEVRNFQLF